MKKYYLAVIVITAFVIIFNYSINHSKAETKVKGQKHQIQTKIISQTPGFSNSKKFTIKLSDKHHMKKNLLHRFKFMPFSHKQQYRGLNLQVREDIDYKILKMYVREDIDYKILGKHSRELRSLHPR